MSVLKHPGPDVASQEEAKVSHASDDARPRRSPLLRLLKATLGIVVVCALCAVLYRERETFLGALRMDLRDFGLIFGFTLASWVANVIAQAALLRALGRELSFVDLLALHVGAALLNHLPMRPGTLYRAHYLKERTGLVYTHFVSFTAMNLLVPIAVAGVIGGLAIVVGYGFSQPEANVLLLALVGCSMASLIALLLPLPRLAASGRVARLWNELLSARATIAVYPRVFVVVAVCHGLSVAFASLRFLGAYSSMGVDVGTTALLVLGSVELGIRLISLTPGGIGIQEMVVAASARLLGVPLATGIVAASVVRAVALLCYVLFGGASLAWLQRARRSRERESQDTASKA